MRWMAIAALVTLAGCEEGASDEEGGGGIDRSLDYDCTGVGDQNFGGVLGDENECELVICMTSDFTEGYLELRGKDYPCNGVCGTDDMCDLYGPVCGWTSTELGDGGC